MANTWITNSKKGGMTAKRKTTRIINTFPVRNVLNVSNSQMQHDLCMGKFMASQYVGPTMFEFSFFLDFEEAKLI